MRIGSRATGAKFAARAGLAIVLLCGGSPAEESESTDPGHRIETISDPAEVARMKARGKPVDLLAAIVAALDGDERLDLDYDDYDRFLRHEADRSRAVFEKRLTDPSLSVDARTDAAQALATIGDPRGAEYLMSRAETEDPHELTIVLRAMNEISPVTRQKAILAASVLSFSFPTNPMLTDELVAELASITTSKEILSVVAARFARVTPDSLPSIELAGALSSLLRARDPELRESAQAIRNRFVDVIRNDFDAVTGHYSLLSLLLYHSDEGDVPLLRAAFDAYSDTLDRGRAFSALVSVDRDPDLVRFAIENSYLRPLARGLLAAKYDVEPALASLRESTGEFGEDEWEPWVLLASRGTREDRAAAKEALRRGALVGEAAYRLAAELSALSTDEALAGLVELGLVRAEDVAMADFVLDEDRFEAEKIEGVLCDGPNACVHPILPEGDAYVESVIHRLVGITSGKLSLESASVTSERDEDEGTGERTIELVVNGVGYRVTVPIDDLDDDDFEPDVTPLVALCNHILETNSIEERIHAVAFSGSLLLFAKPQTVATARERGYLPK